MSAAEPGLSSCGGTHRCHSSPLPAAAAIVVAVRTMQGTVLIRSAEELEGYSRSEEGRIEEVIKAIADSGARVVVGHQAFGEMALHFIEKHGMMAVKIPSKFDLRRFCRATGACGGQQQRMGGRERWVARWNCGCGVDPRAISPPPPLITRTVLPLLMPLPAPLRPHCRRHRAGQAADAQGRRAGLCAAHGGAGDWRHQVHGAAAGQRHGTDQHRRAARQHRAGARAGGGRPRPSFRCTRRLPFQSPRPLRPLLALRTCALHSTPPYRSVPYRPAPPYRRCWTM